MSDFHPYFTSDGSVGLYNIIYNDIYHSATGALTEAYEKFILPVDFGTLLKKEKINVLDICYGIGYNSKSFLNFILYLKKKSKKIFSKFNYIAQIDTDNILNKISKISTDTIDTDNIFSKISVTAVDSDKILPIISPFIKTGVKDAKNTDLDFNSRAVDKFSRENIKSRPRIDKIINFEILMKIIRNNTEIGNNSEFTGILFDKKYDKYFDNALRGIFNILCSEQCLTIPNRHKLSVLHNIYYRYLSKRYKRAAKHLKLNDLDFRLKNADAREFIKSDNGKYDLIFLDAFSPNKCPCLWSYEFFVELFKHLESEGMILTYSTSAAVRAAMIEAGFFVGNIYNGRTGEFSGTIAVKNNVYIKYPLSKFDLGLLKTRAGIFYRDKNLSEQNEAIINARNTEVKNSDRMSSSQYIKQQKIIEML